MISTPSAVRSAGDLAHFARVDPLGRSAAQLWLDVPGLPSIACGIVETPPRGLRRLERALDAHFASYDWSARLIKAALAFELRGMHREAITARVLAVNAR